MIQKKVTDFLLYRSRYGISLIGLIVLLVALLTLAGGFLPGGISAAEMQSATSSIHTPILALNGDETAYLLDLPYHLLQKISILVFGVTALGIKLPSLLIAFFSILALYTVLRMWFRKNVAIITSLIAASSAQFLFIGQLGTPEIMYIFWPTILLLTASMIAYSKRLTPFWLFLLAVTGALSIYTPLLIFIPLALMITCFLHPHARFVVFRKQANAVLLLSAAVFILLLIPLGVGIVREPTLLAEVTGTTFTTIASEHSIQQLGAYTQLAAPAIGSQITPAYSLVILLLVGIGAIRLFTTKYTAKSYILSILLLCMVGAALLGTLPQALTFVPAMLFVAFAISYIIRSWYQLFPLNPYARIAGLLPLAVLVAGVTLSELDRYVYGVEYGTLARTTFNNDFQAVKKTVSVSDEKNFVLLTTKGQEQFYIDFAERLPSKDKSLIVTTNAVEASKKSATHTIIATPPYKSDSSIPTSILVSATSEDSARLYLYKNGYK